MTQAIKQLNEGQASAVAAMNAWLSSSVEQVGNEFVLRGSAGTGKTFCIKELLGTTRGRFVFTAPTNKATKVLKESVSTPTYSPDCRTIHSLLGLRMEMSGELKELKEPDDPIDLSTFKCIVVDEGSMVNKALQAHIKRAADEFKLRVIYMGDPAQLPPVGELTSPIWSIHTGAELTKVMRHDNQILKLAIRLREQVDKPFPRIMLATDAEVGGNQGVWKSASRPFFLNEVAKAAKLEEFLQPGGSKLIAWRNVTVDAYNRLIRETLFKDHKTSIWIPGDRVIFTAPARDLDDKPMAHTDDEGSVLRVEEDDVTTDRGTYLIHKVRIQLDDNRIVTAKVLHPGEFGRYSKEVTGLSSAAKGGYGSWKTFWAFKECFHQLRHAYAITAHRAQGSTYDTAFVDWGDILLNQNRQEAYRCLYVACTRPSRALVLS